jgi:hypothetical protein
VLLIDWTRDDSCSIDETWSEVSPEEVTVGSAVTDSYLKGSIVVNV